LGVPHDPDATVAGAGSVVRMPRELRGSHCLSDCGLDGVELVVASHLLDEEAPSVVLEDDEVADECEQAALIEDAFEDDLEGGDVSVCGFGAADGAPRLEPLAPGGQGADACVGAVGNDE
jgi:hypothetical protein